MDQKPNFSKKKWLVWFLSFFQIFCTKVGRKFKILFIIILKDNHYLIIKIYLWVNFRTHKLTFYLHLYSKLFQKDNFIKSRTRIKFWNKWIYLFLFLMIVSGIFNPSISAPGKPKRTKSFLECKNGKPHSPMKRRSFSKSLSPPFQSSRSKNTSFLRRKNR